MSRAPDVLVIGAGVSGLTTAISLAESGLSVSVLAGLPPQRTTSAVAGAIWGPHLVEEGDRVTRWASETLTVLRGLAGDPSSGVRMASGRQASPNVRPVSSGVAPGALPGWGAELDGLRECTPAELPAGFGHGWHFSAPLLYMPAYLGYLLARLERVGGQVESGTVTSLAGAAREAGARAVVNCAGTGAAALVPDPEVIPVRGQVVVAANPGVREFFIGLPGDSSELVYLFPHGDVVVLGGTEVAGQESLVPDPAVAGRILADCARVEPRLNGAQVIAHRVGLRPFRPRVRLGAERQGEPPGRPGAGSHGAGRGLDQPLVVHNYGHGGAGVTLSWGCAREAADLVRRRLS